MLLPKNFANSTAKLSKRSCTIFVSVLPPMKIPAVLASLFPANSLDCGVIAFVIAA